MKRYNMKYRFTLTELVVVLIITIIMATIIFSLIDNPVSNAKKASCSSNLKQSTAATLLYGNRNDNWLCTYGNNYSPWHAQAGIPDDLNFKLTNVKRSAVTSRLITKCPDYIANIQPDHQSYGAAWFALAPEPYEKDNFEKIVNTKQGKTQYINVAKIPIASQYIILADSAYTYFDNFGRDSIGTQSPLFVRRQNNGGYFPRAIALRHRGEANISYADGHVGDTKDKMKVLAESYIQTYSDAFGRRFIHIK